MTVHNCLSCGIVSRFMNKRRRELLSSRWLVMKLGLVMEEFQDLWTHLNLRTDLTGRFARLISTKSCGRWFLRIGGSLIEDIFQRKDRERERDRANSRSVCHSYPPLFSENKQAIAYNVFIVYCPIFFFFKGNLFSNFKLFNKWCIWNFQVKLHKCVQCCAHYIISLYHILYIII